MNKYQFLQNLIMNINSALELSEAMRATYLYISEYFPIEGISLHRYIPEKEAIQFDFLLTESGFHDLDLLVPVAKKFQIFLTDHENTQGILYGHSWEKSSLALQFNHALSEYIPNKDRTYFATILTVGTKVVGHLCLIGKSANCFEQKHEALLEVLRISLAMTMVHLLKNYKIQKEKLRLEEKKLHENELNLIKEVPIIGESKGLKDTTKIIEQLAVSDAPVLIMGETGTGKELIADAVQRLSSQKNSIYIKINCGAIPESLIDSELFGYQKGAFTGAMQDKLGKFEQANGGTLFLDEVGELSLQSQVRLLRVLQDNVVQRIGGTKPIKVKVRVIAATNRPLENMIKAGTFREDLFHRLNVFPLYIPPLRDRLDDIPLLIEHFIAEFSKKLNITKKIMIKQSSKEHLKSYPWPGNIRELKNLVERALTLNPSDELDLSEYLPYLPSSSTSEIEKISDIKNFIRDEITKALNPKENTINSNTQPSQTVQEEHLNETDDFALDAVITSHIKKVLRLCNYKISGVGGAAEILQMNPSTLRKKMQKLNIKLDHTV